MPYRSIKDLAEKLNGAEQPKAENQMLWVQLMNSIRNRTEEAANNYLLYTQTSKGENTLKSTSALTHNKVTPPKAAAVKAGRMPRLPQKKHQM